MPNAANITSPIVLVGAGRSGTSLLTSILEKHPSISYAGEVANVIFGIWQCLDSSVSGMPELNEGGGLVSAKDRIVRSIRRTFLDLCPHQSSHWCIKPIGVPRAVSDTFPDEANWDSAAEFYWDVMRSTFPDAKYILVLRHPCDIVVSSAEKWGHDIGSLWWSLGMISHMLGHNKAPPLFVVPYARLLKNPENEITRIFSHLELPFDSAVLEALQHRHATERGVAEIHQNAGSRRDQWTTLARADLSRHNYYAISKFYSRFSMPVDWPKHLTEGRDREPRRRRASANSSAKENTRLAKLIAQLNRRIDDANVRAQNQLLEQNREFDRIWRECQDWIAELERAKQWLASQVSASSEIQTQLRSENERLMEQFREQELAQAARTEKIATLERQCAELAEKLSASAEWAAQLKAGNDWLLAQNSSLDRESASLRQKLEEASEWSKKLAEGNQWLKEQNSAIEANYTKAANENYSLREWNSQLIEAKEWLEAQIAALKSELSSTRQGTISTVDGLSPPT